MVEPGETFWTRKGTIVLVLKSGITLMRTRPEPLPRFSTATRTRAARRPLSCRLPRRPACSPPTHVWMPQTPSGCSAVGLCRFRWAHFRYETPQIGDHAAGARRTRTRSAPDLNRVRLPSQIPGMLRKQRKGNVPDTGGNIHKAKRRAADIDDAVLPPGR